MTSNDEGGGSPSDGAYMARIASTGAGNQSSIENFLGIESGGLNAAAASGSGSDNATNGSAVKTTLTVEAGDEISFDWFFDADDYLSYNDFGFVSFNGQVVELADISMVGSYGATGWATYTYTATSSGTLEIGFGAMNTGDSGVNSYLFVDNLQLNGIPIGSSSAEASGPSGSLAGLVSFGADGPGSFGLVPDTSELPTLFSNGVQLVYAVTDSDSDGVPDTLTATAGEGGGDSLRAERRD